MISIVWSKFLEYEVIDKRYCGKETDYLLKDDNFTSVHKALEFAKSVCYADPICKGFYHNENTKKLVKCNSGFKTASAKHSILYLKGKNLHDLRHVRLFIKYAYIEMLKITTYSIYRFNVSSQRILWVHKMAENWQWNMGILEYDSKFNNCCKI